MNEADFLNNVSERTTLNDYIISEHDIIEKSRCAILTGASTNWRIFHAGI